MGQLDNWKMTPLDAMLCSNQLQILKTLVFFFPPARQRMMIFLVKLMELRQCLTLPLSGLPAFSKPEDVSDSGIEMFERIFPYCDHEKQQAYQQMQNAFRMMNTFRQFSESGMFDHLGEMMGGFGETGTPVNPESFAQMAGMNPSAMFSSMMTPEQQALFSEYESMLDNL